MNDIFNNVTTATDALVAPQPPKVLLPPIDRVLTLEVGKKFSRFAELRRLVIIIRYVLHIVKVLTPPSDAFTTVGQVIDST